MEIKVLDHGYVKFIESFGSDERIIEAARMSTAKGFQGWGEDARWECRVCRWSASAYGAKSIAQLGWHTNTHKQRVPNNGTAYCPNCEDETLVEQKPVVGDEKLLRFLWEHHHTTPFEFGGMVIEVQAPLFVFREWHRHRTQSYNEMSARYTPLPDVGYRPHLELLVARALTATKNKQAQALIDPTTMEPADRESIKSSFNEWLDQVDHIYDRVEAVYQNGLLRGIPKEVARIVLPVGRYSRMRASANLWNWLHFLGLRMAPDAQYEIREYAHAVHDVLKTQFPRTVGLFDEGSNR